MMTRFEENIKEKADQIFGGELPNGHKERFMNKIIKPKVGQRNTVVHRMWILSVAGVAAIAVFILVFSLTHVNDKQSIFADNSNSETENVSEVKEYYREQLKNEAAEIEKLTANMEKSDRKEIIKDIEKMQKSEVICANLTTEEQIAIIVNIYKTKIKSLEEIRENLIAYNQ